MEEKNNEIKAQSIIDAIQRYEIGEEGFLDKDVDEAVKKADSFLLDNGEEPCFFEDFVSKTITDLKTTINGCIKSRNNPKKKDDLKKYKEGYFNEIIQNANDVVWKTGSENPTVEMSFFKVGNKYTVRCVYPDKGFSLENIYGFCTRGNSDKKSQNGQEGMYGIGIKSLFCFVDEFEINSNINIKVSSSGEKKLDKVELNVAKDKRSVNGKTILSFSFIYNETGNNNHAGFNIAKLVKFIDKIYEDKIDDEIIRKYFLTGKDEEIIFDARALFFTELRGDNRNCKNSIKKVIINKDETKIYELESREEKVEIKTEIKTEIDNVIVKKVSIIDQDKYLLMHYKDEQISIGFRINSREVDKDRLYSTYFIGTYMNQSPILGVQTGCLINTTEINSSRSGLERENEGEPKVLSEIMYKGKASVNILCELAVEDEEALEVLCKLLYLYRRESELDKEELSPKYIFNGSLEELQKSVAKWTFKERFKFILKEEDGIDYENRLINENRPPNADSDNVSRLFDIYIKYIKKEEGESDIIVRDKGLFEDLGIGIKKLCDALFEENDKLWIRQIAGLPFLSDIKEVIINRIGGIKLAKIQEYLSKIDENDRIFIKQLIARYVVTDCFDYMGRYSIGNFKEWLFGNENYSETDWKNKVKEYEDYYGRLKKLLYDKIIKVEVYKSLCNFASSDLWYNTNQMKDSINSFNDVIIYENDIISLLKLIHDEILKIGTIEGKPIITDCDYEERLRNRDRKTTGWDKYIKFFYLDILNVAFTTFKGFVAARNYIDKYNETVKNEDFKINYINQCKIKTVTIPELRSIFNWLATYELSNIWRREKMFIFGSVELDKALESDSELIRFIKQFIGGKFYVKTESISVNNNCKFIGYIISDGDKNDIYIKQSANDPFVQVGRIVNKSDEKYLLVFYSNCDEQSSLSEVLAHIGYGDDICEYIKNFIKTGNIKNLSSEMYNRYLKKKRLEYEYPFEFDEIEKASICENLSIEDTYSVLSVKMSYDGHCPICNQIPTLNIKLHETNINRLERRNSMIAMLVARYREKDIYIKILCCKNCFEEYKNSLSEARVEDVDGELYKVLILKSKISTTNRTHDIVNRVKISPDNWEIICKFNRL